MSDVHDALDDFDGTARLFPLPNLVLFPQVVQPLHIFEPRYRQMTADALADNRLIALVLPLPGWEADYAEAPAIHPVACLGRIVAEQRLSDGRFNLLLRGLRRIHLREEIAQPNLYRLARAELLDDLPCTGPDEQQWRQRLREQVPTWLQGQGEILQQFNELLHGNLALGTLCDILAFTLPLEAEFKQTLLAELDVTQRLNKLWRQLEGPHGSFPPKFSIN